MMMIIQLFFSSPEHKVSIVSYCDHPRFGIHGHSVCVLICLFVILVMSIEKTRSACHMLKNSFDHFRGHIDDSVLMKSECYLDNMYGSSNLSHLGLKTRSPGQIKIHSTSLESTLMIIQA